VINRAQKKGDGDSTRLISKELSDLRKVPTLVGDCISGPFAPWEDVQWSSHTVRLTDHVINDALRTGSGCLCPTTGGNSHILEGIQPVELRRKGATLSPERRAMEPAPLLHSAFTNPPSGNAWHLKSRHPVAPAARLCFSYLTTRAVSPVIHTYAPIGGARCRKVPKFIPIATFF